MDTEIFENIKIKVLKLEPQANEYKEIVRDTIGRLFINIYELQKQGLFCFKNFTYNFVEDEVFIDKFMFEDQGGKVSNEYMIHILEKRFKIKINSIDDTIVVAWHNGNGYYMNLSSCKAKEEVINKLQEIITKIYPDIKIELD